MQAGAHGSDQGRLDLTVEEGEIIGHRRTLVPLDHDKVPTGPAAERRQGGWCARKHWPAKAPDGGKPMLKAVIHINFDDGERQKHGLKNVANILKEVKGAEIEVVCHGGRIWLLVNDRSAHADEVDQLIKKGVRFAACENTLRDKSIPKENLLPGVATVPSAGSPAHSSSGCVTSKSGTPGPSPSPRWMGGVSRCGFATAWRGCCPRTSDEPHPQETGSNA